MKIHTKRHICLAICVISFLAMIGAVGGIECNTLTVKTGAAIMLVSLPVMFAAGYKGGYIKL